MTINPNPRASHKPAPFTTEQIKRLGQLLEGHLVAPAALKAVGLTEQQLREAGFKGVLNSQNLVAWLSAKTVDHDVRLGITEQTANTAVARAEDVAARLAAYMESNELQLDALRIALQAGAIGGRKSFITALRAAKVTDQQIRQVIVLVDDGNEIDLTDEQLFAEVFESMRSLRADVTTLTGRVDVHERVLGPEGRNITSLTGRVRHLEDAVVGRFPKWGWLVVGVVAVVAGLFWHAQNFTIVKSTVVGDVTVVQTSTSPGGIWWYPWAIGFFTAIVTWGIIAFFTGRARSRTRTDVDVRAQAQSSFAPPSVEATKVLAPVRDEQPTAPTSPTRIPVAVRNLDS